MKESNNFSKLKENPNGDMCCYKNPVKNLSDTLVENNASEYDITPQFQNIFSSTKKSPTKNLRVDGKKIFGITYIFQTMQFIYQTEGMQTLEDLFLLNTVSIRIKIGFQIHPESLEMYQIHFGVEK